MSNRTRSAESVNSTELGHRLRQLRLDRGLSLREVAARTQLSPSFISLLENGETDVAFGRLQRLLAGIEATLADALPAESLGQASSTTSPQHGLEMLAPGISLVTLSPPNSDVTAGLVRVESNAAMQAWTSSTADAWIYVLAGRIRVRYSDGESVLLEPDASLLLLAGRPYKIMNVLAEESRLLRVQPHRRRVPTWLERS